MEQIRLVDDGVASVERDHLPPLPRRHVEAAAVLGAIVGERDHDGDEREHVAVRVVRAPLARPVPADERRARRARALGRRVGAALRREAAAHVRVDPIVEDGIHHRRQGVAQRLARGEARRVVVDLARLVPLAARFLEDKHLVGGDAVDRVAVGVKLGVGDERSNFGNFGRRDDAF